MAWEHNPTVTAPAEVQQRLANYVNISESAEHREYRRKVANALSPYAPSVANKVRWCGRNHRLYYDSRTDSLKVKQRFHCHQPLLCPTCHRTRHEQRFPRLRDQASSLLQAEPELLFYHATFTCRPRDSISDSFDQLSRSLDQFTTKNTRHQRGYIQAWIGDILGGLVSIEITPGEDWHVHAHAILVSRTPLKQRELRKVWKEFTGDSDNVKIRPFDSYENIKHRKPENMRRHLLRDFTDVFAYIHKFPDLPPEQCVELYRALSHNGAQRRRHMTRVFGVFRGIEKAKPSPQREQHPQAIELRATRDPTGQWRMPYRDKAKLKKRMAQRRHTGA